MWLLSFLFKLSLLFITLLINGFFLKRNLSLTVPLLLEIKEISSSKSLVKQSSELFVLSIISLSESFSIFFVSFILRIFSTFLFSSVFIQFWFLVFNIISFVLTLFLKYCGISNFICFKFFALSEFFFG